MGMRSITKTFGLPGTLPFLVIADASFDTKENEVTTSIKENPKPKIFLLSTTTSVLETQ
jgi:hypothetical protein